MQSVLERIVPSKEEEKSMKKTVESLVSKVQREADRLSNGLVVNLVGSVSRRTWLRSDKDLDIFISFPLNCTKMDLENVVTMIGSKILKTPEKHYAEHPYVIGYYENYKVELVPCYKLKNTLKLKSAVDRTPFHDKFVKGLIPGKETDVRLLKQFLKGIGCYGAESKVNGFSGYLCELLVINNGSFKGVLENARKWKNKEVIVIDGSIEETKILKSKFASPLIVIDPVDENRNVASALSATNFGIFCYAARIYLDNPSESFFFPVKKKVQRGKTLKIFEKRGTNLLAVFFKKPQQHEEILYNQGRKGAKVIEKYLIRKGFRVLHSDFFVNNNVCLFFELETLEIPPLKVHFGPETNTLHEIKFLEKYHSSKKKLTEPFIQGKRWVIYLNRDYSSVIDILKYYLSQEDLNNKGVPKHISRSLKDGFKISVNNAVFSKEFLNNIEDFLNPRFPWEV
tara:strand:+ start:2784 stop:4145 length:1362 start_codon:yes stop_codon:yes gene_type:complete